MSSFDLFLRLSAFYAVCIVLVVSNTLHRESTLPNRAIRTTSNQTDVTADPNEPQFIVNFSTNYNNTVLTHFIQNLVDDVHNFTIQLPNNPILTSITNGTLAAVETGNNVVTQSVLRPLSYFIGQNLRLLGNGMWSLGHTMKHSGYGLTQLEPILQNTSKALTEFGTNLINQNSNITAT